MLLKKKKKQLLGDMLLDRSNAAVMVRYVSSLDNMRILMNLLRVCFLLYSLNFQTCKPNIKVLIIFVFSQFAGFKQDNSIEHLPRFQGLEWR